MLKLFGVCIDEFIPYFPTANEVDLWTKHWFLYKGEDDKVYYKQIHLFDGFKARIRVAKRFEVIRYEKIIFPHLHAFESQEGKIKEQDSENVQPSYEQF